MYCGCAKLYVKACISFGTTIKSPRKSFKTAIWSKMRSYLNIKRTSFLFFVLTYLPSLAYCQLNENQFHVNDFGVQKILAHPGSPLASSNSSLQSVEPLKRGLAMHPRQTFVCLDEGYEQCPGTAPTLAYRIEQANPRYK
jgi:hypothetical protein